MFLLLKKVACVNVFIKRMYAEDNNL